MIKIWLLTSFLVPGNPIVVDNFPFTTQSGCAMALFRWGPAAKSLNIGCVDNLVTKEELEKMLKELHT